MLPFFSIKFKRFFNSFNDSPSLKFLRPSSISWPEMKPSLFVSRTLNKGSIFMSYLAVISEARYPATICFIFENLEYLTIQLKSTLYLIFFGSIFIQGCLKISSRLIRLFWGESIFLIKSMTRRLASDSSGTTHIK